MLYFGRSNDLLVVVCDHFRIIDSVVKALLTSLRKAFFKSDQLEYRFDPLIVSLVVVNVLRHNLFQILAIEMCF